ncbi:MAG TPA: hypothetical protein VGD66_03230 [Allosphingosinicella sp.]
MRAASSTSRRTSRSRASSGRNWGTRTIALAPRARAISIVALSAACVIAIPPAMASRLR